MSDTTATEETAVLARQQPHLHQMVPTAPEPRGPSIVSLLEGVINQGVTPDNVAALDKLCDLYERMENKRAEREFNAAFATLQSEMPQIAATQPVPNRDGTIRYRFAPFEEIMEKAQPYLTKNGFAVSFNTRFGEGRLTAICTLRHISGHSQNNEFAVRIGQGPPGSTETQADGAAKTYAKRGALSDALNIVVDKDDDARLIGAFITQLQADELRQRVREMQVDEEKFLKFAGAAHYEAISEDRLDSLHAMLDRKQRGSSRRNEKGEFEW